MSDPILRELFHNCALVAFVEEAKAQGGWPERAASREHTYRIFEREPEALQLEIIADCTSTEERNPSHSEGW